MTTVDRFTSIIDAFDGTTMGLSLDQVATRANLPRSTTHRILDHLVRLGWLTHGEPGYGLGERTRPPDTASGGDLRVREAAAPVLHQLHVLTAAVVHLGVLHRDEIVHVDKLGGRDSSCVPTWVGMRIPAHHVGLGIAALATLSRNDAVSLGVTSDVLAALPARERDGAICRVNDYGFELVSISAPIDLGAALGIVVPMSVSPERYKPLVLSAANKIRVALI